MANIVAGTRSQPPTISTMVFVSQNCRPASSIWQQEPPVVCRIRRPYPILNPHKGHNLQLLAYQRPSFSRNQAARYDANKRANNKLLLAFVSVIARGLFFVKTTVADRPPKIYVLLKGCFSRIRPSDSAGEGGCCCDIKFAGRQFRLANAILLLVFLRVC